MTVGSDEKTKRSLPPEEKEKYRRLYDISRDSFNEQIDRIEALDRKAQINLLVIGIVLGFGLFKPDLICDSLAKISIGELITNISIGELIASSQVLFLAGSFFFFVISLVFSILVLIPKPVRVYPDVIELAKTFENRRTEDLDASMSSFFQKIIDENENYLKSKTRHLKNAIICILIAFPLSVIFVIMTVVVRIFCL